MDLQVVCEQKDLVALLVSTGVLNEILEYWLGKTPKTVAGSKWELIGNGIKAILNMFKKKENIMNPQIANGTLAKNINFEIKIIDGKLRGEVGWVDPAGNVEAGVFVNLKPQQVASLVIDGIERAIPGDQTGIAATLKLQLGNLLNKEMGVPAPAPVQG